MTTFLQSLIGSGLAVFIVLAVVGVMAYALREWMSTHIRLSVKHQFDLDLEEFKNEIGQLSAQLNSVQSVTNAALVGGQAAILDRRIEAASDLWKEVLRLRNEAHPVLGLLDLLYETEYQRFVCRPAMKKMVPDIEETMSHFSPVIDRVRLFVGEETFMKYFIYRATTGRILVLLSMDVKAGLVTPWYNDEGIKEQLSALLSDEELKEFQRLRLGRIRWLEEVVENKILSDLRSWISGEQLAGEVLAEAQKIRVAIQSDETQLERLKQESSQPHESTP